MTWLSIVQSLLSLVTGLVTYLNNRKLIESGEALAILEGINHARQTIDKAREARLRARDKFDNSNGVPDDDDPNLRD